MRRDAIAQTLLLDYYGELLTQKQRLYCDLYYNQDYSLAEIADQFSVSRQSVHDTVSRTEKKLVSNGIEGQLGPGNVSVPLHAVQRSLKKRLFGHPCLNEGNL